MRDSSLSRGKRVVAHCHNDLRRENIVWELGRRVVYLCSEPQYMALREGRHAPPPIGFPIHDVEPVG